MRWRMISLSTVVWKIEPFCSSSSRSADALVRLPLWAMAIWPAGAIDGQGLGIAQVRGAGGRIAGVPKGHAAHQPVQHVAIEYLWHQAHPLVDAELAAVRRHDPGAFLSPVLERKEAVVGKLRGIGMAIDPKYAAIMFRSVLHPIRFARPKSNRASRFRASTNCGESRCASRPSANSRACVWRLGCVVLRLI
jgi:hypothetical protein